MLIGKFQQENGVYAGTVQTLTGASLAVRIAPTDLKGIDYLVTLVRQRDRARRRVEQGRQGERHQVRFGEAAIRPPSSPRRGATWKPPRSCANCRRRRGN